MSVLVVYESMYGNTHRIAEAIGRGLRDGGSAAEVLTVEAAHGRALGTSDVLILGGPTHAHGLSREASRQSAVDDARKQGTPSDPAATGPGVREWLETLHARGARAAAFDTRIKGPATLTGRASQKISKELRHHGLEPLVEPESFLVTFANELVPGEEDRARSWGELLAKRI
jgi:hypothetical protein